jgi:hypothetical protein
MQPVYAERSVRNTPQSQTQRQRVLSDVLVVTESVRWINLLSVYLDSELILVDTQTVYRPGIL